MKLDDERPQWKPSFDEVAAMHAYNRTAPFLLTLLIAHRRKDADKYQRIRTINI
jgi:hypothetical protein